jgi:hypothetical protein
LHRTFLDGSITHSGRKRDENYAFVAVLAEYWPDLMGKPPVAYRERVTNTPRGDFWPFVLASCKAVGIEPPEIDSVEKWVRENKRWKLTT